jgi:O-antigen biosynthesis protein
MNVLLTTSAAPSQTPFSTNEKRPPIGLGFLISVLRDAGHNVSFIDNYLNPSDFLETDYLQRHQIDCVGIYTNTICFRDSLRMIYRLENMRQEGFWKGKIIAGGPHASVSPETIPSFVDHIVIGEGEYAIRDIAAGKVQERVVQYPAIENLDELPMPGWDYFAEMPYDWGGNWLPEAPVFTMNTSRGCPFDCTFCSVGSIWGRRYTFFSAERVVADIEYVVKQHGARGIYFREDNFTLNKKRLYDFCNLMIAKGINIPWVCETRASSLDRETVELMARAGAKGAYIGVESGSQRLLDFMQKAIKIEDIHRAFRLCQEFGINTAASVIVGVPTETEQELQMTMELLNEIKPTITWFNVFVGIPKSKLYTYVLENKLYEYIDDRGLVYLKGHNERARKWYGQAWDAGLPIQLENDTIINPRVSVIMSVYNGDKSLLEAIKSIQNQTFNNFEFLIVNDASSDRTTEILQKIDDPRIRIFTNEHNFGLTRSLNKVVNHCRGEFIARMDADDISMPHRLEKQLKFMEENPECILLGTQIYIIDDNSKIKSMPILPNSDSEIKNRLLHGNVFCHGSIMVKKVAFEKIGYYSNEFTYAQDYDAWLKLSEIGNIANMQEYLYMWRDATTGISTHKRNDQNAFALLAKKYAVTRQITSCTTKKLPALQHTNYSLTELIDSGLYHTDKSGYLPIYEDLMHGLKNAAAKVLEIGVLDGGSLKLWRDYLSDAIIVGLDINFVRLEDTTGRIKLYQGSQDDTNLLDNIAHEQAPGGFDIIIDDASHIGSLTRTSFWHLFDHHLKPGGIYVVEDWGTGYWPNWHDGAAYNSGVPHVAGMVGFLKELVDEVARKDIMKSGIVIDMPEHGTIASLQIHNGLIICRKAE